ncbi:AAA-like domain-containing protein [Microcoleus sp.]|uniref:nSTAND1 domain-containing NTPase n=1 Tax=Microcoleus sp. TaxID=44472 RepID=UPI003525AAD4
MAPRSPSPCPFSAPSMLKNPDSFVGRKEELKFIENQMTGPQPTSVNIVGPHKIGKSSLLWHFYKRCNRHSNNSSPYAVIYLSFQDGECQEENSLYQKLAQELSKVPIIQTKPSLVTVFQAPDWNRSTFAKAIRLCEEEKILPVLCIDKFEALFQDSYREKFDEGFYDNLHSLINHSSMMLVLISIEPLDFYRTQNKLTSSFFNVGSECLLKKFSEAEAKKLVDLPQGNIVGARPALTEKNQQLALQWGEEHPVRLQLAGKYLWEAQQNSKSVKWAKQQFQYQSRKVLELQTRPKRPQKLGQWLRWLFWDVPFWVGNLTTGFWLKLDDLFTRITGIIVIVVLIMFVRGVIPGDIVSDFFKKLLCNSLGGLLGKWCDG